MRKFTGKFESFLLGEGEVMLLWNSYKNLAKMKYINVKFVTVTPLKPLHRI